MSRKHKRGYGSFTVLIVPHSERPPVSLRIPVLTVYLALLMPILIGVYIWQTRLELQTAEDQLAHLRREQQVAVNRQIDLRATIYGQQEQLQNLEGEVSRLHAGVQQMDRIVGEIRKVVGLDSTIPTTNSATNKSPAARKEELLEQGTSSITNGIGPLSTSNSAIERAFVPSPSPEIFGQRARAEVNQLLAETPGRLEGLNGLQQTVLNRVARVDTSTQYNPAKIENQLRVWDAAPKTWPVYGPITSRFGWRVIFGANDFHEGLDVGVPWGTPVRVPTDGVVTLAGWKGTYGWTVEVAHDMGFSTLYGHLSSYMVEVGDKIKAGTVIGYVGNSGKSTGPHLHYEISVYGTQVDPLKYLSQ